MRWARLAKWPLLEALIWPVAAAAYVPGGPAGPVELSQPWAIPAASGGDASIMFALHNYGDVPDNLVAAACATAESVELVGPAQNGGAATRLEYVFLAPGQGVTLTPDGVHLVLHHLNVAAQVGQILHCTATFSRSGERLFEASVRQAAPPAPPPI